MDTPISTRILASLTPEELAAPTKELLLANHRRELQSALQSMGYERVEFPAESPSFANRFEEAEPHWPDIIATFRGKKVCICFAPVAPHIAALEALSPQQCACCEQHFPQHDVYYAALLLNMQEQQLILLDPTTVRYERRWCTNSPEDAQFLPYSRRRVSDRYSPLLGSCALVKLSHLFIPHALSFGQLPRFTVRGLFEDKEQGSHGAYALMSMTPPTHFMLVGRDPDTDELTFRRPFFFYGDRPHAELELMRCTGGDVGLVELLDKTGLTLYAESVEASIFSEEIAVGLHYKWTLSLVADRCHLLKREFALSGGPVLEQAKRDYVRLHGSNPPHDFSVRVSTESIRTFIQKPQQSYTELCGRITHIEEVSVDAHCVLLMSLLPLTGNDDVEVQVFTGLHVLGETRPEVGDVVECTGFLYASPDAVVENAESWQDSGAVAALQEARELKAHRLNAYRQYSGYSLAQGVVAATFAQSGYRLLAVPGTHTRDDATFLVQGPKGDKRVLFVETLIGDAEPQFAYTEEQQQSILERHKATHGDNLSAHRCTVRLQRAADSEAYEVQLQVKPECPDIDPTNTICEAVQCPLPGKLSEAVACRIICNAIGTQDWNEFARTAAEDATYISHVNGTRTLGKIEYIRYMAERKKLWEEQMGWPGMRMETGTVTYKGKQRDCFSITCYGRRVGTEVVNLRGGFIADMETVPLEDQESFVPDEECSRRPRIFHPMRGLLYAYSEQQSPLQRFSAAYLQECMARKTGLYGKETQAKNRPLSGGVEFSLSRPDGARWLKLVSNGPSFFDLAFAYADKIYAVRTIEVENHPDHSGDLNDTLALLPDRDQFVAFAEQYGLIPCVFPARLNHTPDPELSWNLWDLRTLSPLHPELSSNKASAPPSDWEILNAALTELKKLTERSGGRVLGCHDVPELLPHFWFYNAKGQVCWMIVRPHADASHTDRTENEAERRTAQLTRGAQGYAVDVTAWADPEFTIPARSGAPLHLRISEPEPLSGDQ